MTRLILLPLLLGLATGTQAQLRLPTLPQITQPLGDRLRGALDPLRERAAALREALDLRSLADERLARHPRELVRNAAGELVVRRQLLALPSSEAARVRLLAEPGVELIEETDLEGLDLRGLLLRADTALLPRLRALDPEGQIDYQHVYLPSGTAPPAATPREASQAAPRPAGSAAAPRLGLIDSGVLAAHPALHAAVIERAGCADGAAHPAAHGTAVASLLVGSEGRFRGAAPEARLAAYDAYCDAPDGGSAQRVAQGLAWLAREHRATVVNISLVGPPNLLLQAAVAAARQRGLLIVAAVGNEGPAAPPLYPAAWPGVVAVTGVDPKRRVLPEAGRGPHVTLAAPGSGLWGAAEDGRYAELRGTSFAAPLVAALLAREPDPLQALNELRAGAIDLGAPGRDDVYGSGLVGEALRTQRP